MHSSKMFFSSVIVCTQDINSFLVHFLALALAQVTRLQAVRCKVQSAMIQECYEFLLAPTRAENVSSQIIKIDDNL